MLTVDEIKTLLDNCSEEEQGLLFQYLRRKFLIHPLEKQFNAPAELILESISRSPDITQRGVRGIIAEAAFKQYVIDNLAGWQDITPAGDSSSYDFLLDAGISQIRIQVKMQRLKAGKPMAAKEGYRFLSPDKFVVETQRTRGGIDKKTSSDTRPYKFGEFDILAVSMHPSCGNWSCFLYAVADWLLPRKDAPDLLLKFQPVPRNANDEWTDDLVQCIEWFRSGEKKKISE
jgi:hypothetical protein